jgi:7,8-dihydropterin-6-yl-methyl-4-(beta-D-ribofuranosyl)aminobenzene 5'-phosphate synthase
MCKKTILVAAVILLWVGASAAYADGRITILYDAFGKPSELKKDWGFSALVEVNGKQILFDTGNNAEIFAHNVKAEGVDLTKLDFVVISHRYGDHIGGLDHLLSVNPEVKIYAPQEGFGVFGFVLPGSFYPPNESLPPEQRYFGGDPPETLHYGTAWPEANFTLVSEATEVASGFHLIALKGDWGTDPRVMGLSLAIDTPKGIVLVVGCGHPTIEKIVQTAKAAINKPIHLVVGAPISSRPMTRRFNASPLRSMTPGRLRGSRLLTAPASRPSRS